MEADSLAQAEKRLTHGGPAAAFGVPVVAAKVGANPDIGPPGLVGADVIGGRFEQRRQVARGACPPVAGDVNKASGVWEPRGLFVVFSKSTQWAEPTILSVSTSCWRPVASFESPPRSPLCCMLGDRSSRMIVVSGRPPATNPSQPLASGRLMAKIRPAIAAMRNAIINHCRIRA